MSRQLPTWTPTPNEALVASHDTVIIDIGSGFSYPELIQGLQSVLKFHKALVLCTDEYDQDPRPIAQIPEARQRFYDVAVNCGVLGILRDHQKLGLGQCQPSFDDYLVCCLGALVKTDENKIGYFEIQSSERAILLRQSLSKYHELYPQPGASDLSNSTQFGRVAPPRLDLFKQLEKSRTEAYRPLKISEPIVVGGWKLK
jgi:hypothetical protein